MKQNNIYLVGFMGSGKTSILKKIKQIVNANTIDLDENIEKKYGSINKIFQTKGEKYFRNIELETFQALPDNDTVIALGGGSLEVSHILDEFKNSELSFYLKDTFEKEKITENKAPNRPTIKFSAIKKKSNIEFETLNKSKSAGIAAVELPNNWGRPMMIKLT